MLMCLLVVSNMRMRADRSGSIDIDIDVVLINNCAPF